MDVRSEDDVIQGERASDQRAIRFVAVDLRPSAPSQRRQTYAHVTVERAGDEDVVERVHGHGGDGGAGMAVVPEATDHLARLLQRPDCARSATSSGRWTHP